MKILNGFLLFVLCATPLLAPAGNYLPAVDVSPAHSNNPERTEPEWVYRGYDISLKYFCDHEEGLLGWPEIQCSEPYLELAGLGDGFIEVGDVKLGVDVGSWRNASSQGLKIYKELVTRDDPIIYLESSLYVYEPLKENIRLVDFKKRSDAYVSSVGIYHKELLAEYRRSWLISALLWALGIPSMIFVAWRLIRRLAPLASRAKVFISGLPRLSRNRFFELKVRGAAIDEAVRQATRQRLSESREQEKEVFIRRIQEALEKGDIDTAKALSSVLEKDNR